MYFNVAFHHKLSVEFTVYLRKTSNSTMITLLFSISVKYQNLKLVILNLHYFPSVLTWSSEILTIFDSLGLKNEMKYLKKINK